MSDAIDNRDHPRLTLSLSFDERNFETANDFQQELNLAIGRLKNAGFILFERNYNELRPNCWIDDGTSFNPYKFNSRDQIYLRISCNDTVDLEKRLMPNNLSKRSSLVKPFSIPFSEARIYFNCNLDRNAIIDKIEGDETWEKWHWNKR